MSLARTRRRFGPGNITDAILETVSPEVEKHVKIPLALGYPGYSLPSSPGQRRRKHTREKSVRQMENSKTGRDVFIGEQREVKIIHARKERGCSARAA